MTPPHGELVGQEEAFVIECLTTGELHDHLADLRALVRCRNYEYGSTVNLAIRQCILSVEDELYRRGRGSRARC